MSSNEKYDFFDGDDIIEQNPAPVETPEEREEKEIANDTIKRGYNRLRAIVYGIAALLIIGFSTWLWMRYFHPYTKEAQQTGRIMEVKLEGYIFNTYEGKLLSEKYVDYPDKWIDYDFPFSIEEDSVARQIMRLQGSGKRVTITYKEYLGKLPWRGNSQRIVTACEISK